MIVERRFSGWAQKRLHSRKEEEQRGETKSSAGSKGDGTDNALANSNGTSPAPQDTEQGDAGGDIGNKSLSVRKENPAARQPGTSSVLPHIQPANEKSGAVHITSQPANEKSGSVLTYTQLANDRTGVLLSPGAQKTTYNPITHAPSKLHMSYFLTLTSNAYSCTGVMESYV